jgi:hypothetical protein
MRIMYHSPMMRYICWAPTKESYGAVLFTIAWLEVIGQVIFL